MHVAPFADKLVSARTIQEIDLLLTENHVLTDEDIAFAIKDICYEAWAKEPGRTTKAARALMVLSNRSTSPVVDALRYWVEGIAKLTQGKLSTAIARLDTSNNLFISQNKQHLAAQTQVSKLYALALLGRYDEAVGCGSEALKVFEAFGDELAAGKIEKNIGNLLSRQEKHHEAEAFYLRAYKRFRKLSNDSELTMCENGLAMTYSALNSFKKAEKYYVRALNRARKLDLLLTQAEIEASMGNLSLFRAQFDRALKLLESSRQKFEQLGMPHQSTVAELEIGDAYLELSLVEEALEIFEKCAENLSALKMQGEEARARLNLARAALRLGKSGLAEKELEKSAALYRNENNPAGEAFVKLIETQLHFTLGDYQKASSLAKETARQLRDSESLRFSLLSTWLGGEILRKLNKFDEAVAVFNSVTEEAGKQENQFFLQAAETSLGELALTQGFRDRAENHFRRSIDLIEGLREPLPADDIRIAFFADKVTAFRRLAQLYLEQGKTEEAFLLIEQSRSRDLADAMTGKLEEKSAENDVSATIDRKIAELREELNWLYSRINRASNEESRPLLIESRDREKRINELRRQSRVFALQTGSDGRSFDLPALYDQLGKDRILLEYVNFGDSISVFALADGRMQCFENIAEVGHVAGLIESLHFQFETMRYGDSSVGGFAAELKRKADFYLKKLYEQLISPVAVLLKGRHVVIVPFGQLHYLPFHALFDGTRYLIEQCEVSYAPGSAVLLQGLAKPQRKLVSVFVMGADDETIPLVKDEVEQITSVFSDHLSFTSDRATFANFKRHAPGFDIIHLACHGHFRKDNPMFSSLRLSDGLLTARDIAELKLSAGLAVLSACETGLNKVLSGDELLGLTRGFLAAGVSSLVLTLWNVNDKATLSLILDFYRHLREGRSVAGSLREAQNKAVAANLHPYFWSPFFLSGNW